MTTITETKLDSLIQRKPGVNGGRPCLAGTGFSVHQVSVHYNEGMSAEEILAEYPHLDLTRIYAGITYYLANREWIDAELAEEAEMYWAEVRRRKALRAAQG
jgi:uncharacterized protein (DUF433 family)